MPGRIGLHAAEFLVTAITYIPVERGYRRLSPPGIRHLQICRRTLAEMFQALGCWAMLIIKSVKESEVMKSVKDILKNKGNDVWAVKPDDTVLDTLKLMALVGIVTERDYARKVILEGKSSQTSSVSEVMTRKVLCVTPTQTVDECMALMTDKRARHLPVLDHKHVIGVVSIGDLVKAMISEQQVIIDQLQHYISG
jgi:signal-transduction protein with cAMP-binding, CBS, and nucleotidyltransferase domain